MKILHRTLVSTLIIFSSRAISEDYFDPALLSGENGEFVDLSVFSHAGGGVEGEQDVSVYINDRYYTRQKLNFTNVEGYGLLPEFPYDFFDNILHSEHQPKAAGKVVSSEDIFTQIPYSEISFNQGESRVDIRIPQAFLGKSAQLRSSPETWDDGLPAILVDYRLTGNDNNSERFSSRSLYASAHLGINIGGWRLRTTGNYSYYRYDSLWSYSQSEKISFYNSYIEHDISKLRSSLRVGEQSTGGLILDSINFKGARLYSNDSMLVPYLRNYSPTVRGVANSQAVVIIRQNGREVYQANVPAGPFELNDFSISGYSGDLLVTIRESDGSEHSFIQPFSSLPEMKREGISGFELSAGYYDNDGQEKYYDNPGFLYGAWSYGFSKGITIFGEGLLAEKYQTIGAGSTLSLDELGAISADISVSRTNKYDSIHTGQSYGVKYSKSQLETGTTLTLATYRYSTKDFYTFSDFAYNREQVRYVWENRLKNRLTLSLSQSLGEYGSLSVNASQQDYWTSGLVNRSFSLSHSFNWNDIFFSTTFSIDQMHGGRYSYDNNHQINLYMSVPLNRLLGIKEPTNSSISWNATRTDNHLRHTASLNGNIPDTSMRYSVGGFWGNRYDDRGQKVSLTWDSDFMSASLGYTHERDYKTVDFGLSGSAVAWSGGIAFGNNNVTDNGAIVVKTGGVSGIQTSRGVSTSWVGTALISSPDLYTENRIDLHPENLPEDIVIGETTGRAVPNKGAVVVLDYPVYRGGQVVFSLKQKNGSYVPFGAVVSLDNRSSDKQNTGIVGDDGRVYMAGVPDEGSLNVSWGYGKECKASFNGISSDKSNTTPVKEREVTCE